jgi:hypothetical protein
MTSGIANPLVIVSALIKGLVGFGRACTPLRCAHPSFWAHYHAKRGAARPPPIAASLLLIYPQKLSLIGPNQQYAT